MHSAQSPPSPLFPSLLFFFFPHTLCGKESPGQPSAFSKWEACFLLGMQRVKAILGPNSGPREGGSFATSSQATGLVRPLPVFPWPPLLCTPCTPLKCRCGSVRAQPGSRSHTTVWGPRPKQWHSETRAGGGRASLLSAAGLPAGPRGQGVRGDRVLRAGSCRVPGANSDVATSTLAPLPAAAARGTVGWGFGGAFPSAQPRVGGGLWEPG